jgi:Uma2 family endonuclease
MALRQDLQHSAEPIPHYWTLEEYHLAIEAGVFGDRRVELLHGEVVEPGAPLKPYVENVQLVIEVSQSSRRRDMGSKLEDYLRDGLRELWIIDLVEQCALIYLSGQLVARHPRGAGAQLSPELVAELSVDLDRVFEAARLPSSS